VVDLQALKRQWLGDWNGWLDTNLREEAGPLMASLTIVGQVESVRITWTLAAFARADEEIRVTMLE